MPDTTEDEKIWKFKSKTLIVAFIAILSFTTPLIVSAALTFYEFKAMQIKLDFLEATHKADEKETNRRLDVKTERNKTEIDNLKNKL